MKEYTITMNFTIESKKDYDEISDFAERFAEDMMNDEKLNYNGIEITNVSVHDIVGEYDEEENIYLNNEDDE